LAGFFVLPIAIFSGVYHGYRGVVVSVIWSFADVATADIHHSKDTKAARTLPKGIWPVIRHKLDYLNAAQSLADLKVRAETSCMH
jgi:hypothetical protein